METKIYISSSQGEFRMIEDLVKALCYITGDNYDDMIGLQDLLDYKYFLVKDGKFVDDGHYDFRVKCKSNEIEGIGQKSHPGSEIYSPVKEWGKWFDWGYFKVRAYKKGTIHFEFKDEKVWAQFNQRVAKLKGYPLPEAKKQTNYQAKQTYSKPAQPAYNPVAQKPKVMATFQF